MAADNHNTKPNVEDNTPEMEENDSSYKSIARKIIENAKLKDQPEAEPQEGDVNALLAQKDEEIAALKDQALRALAEVENMRRRAKQQVEDATQYAVTNFARDMVEVLENLYRASSTITPELIQNSPALQAICDGVNMTQRECLSAFERHGVRRIDPLGLPFDHNLHQAISHVPTAESPPGTVIHVVQAGYTIKDRLLRPAMVAVAKAPEESA
ncbi:MAG: grpE [Rickettsiales bacterium]|jgi:molecular chaperone GrpE|nr:grpE [Rickettsiales bacterium]